MVEIKIFHSTPPCAKCMKTKEVAEKLAKKYSEKVKVVEFNALSPEAEKYGVILTPTTIVGESVFATGNVPNESKLEETLKKEIGG